MSDSSGSNRSTLDDSPAVELTGKIMVVAIIVLFVVVVFVLCLHLYAKWFWWRVEEDDTPTPVGTRRRRRRRFVFAPGQDPAIATTLRKGLEPSVLRSLPVLIFNPTDFKDGLECAVCLSELEQGEKARMLPKCNHGFHVDCIDMWFQSHSTCPLCRDPVAPEISNSNTNSNAEEAEDFESLGENLDAGFSTESPNFPTNVLFWGNETQVSARAACPEEGHYSQCPPCPSSSSSPASSSSRPPDGMLVIDIPRQMIENLSPLPSSASRFAEEESKSPVTTRLRSLRRLLSRERRPSPRSPGSVDVEQAGRGQS